MRIIRKEAVQVHPVPKKVTSPQGPFPPELQGYNPGYAEGLTEEGGDVHGMSQMYEQAHPAAQPDIVTDYQSAVAEDGANFPLGSTAQNNFTPPKYVRCAYCMVRVLDSEKQDHVCED